MHIHLSSRSNLARKICHCAFVGALIGSAPTLAETKFQDPLDSPAVMRTAVNTRPLMAITYAGAQLIAVGSRGMIARSEDQGKSWSQSAVPVQSDLLAVHFPTALDGWAVGHDGVILHSSDGGKNWVKQLDGRIAAETFKKYYAAQAAIPQITEVIGQLKRNYKAGPALPWLGVWFEDAKKGFVVGSYGMIAATVDGGKTWEPWLHRIDNDHLQPLNLNCIREIGENLYIGSERGMVFKLDRGQQRFDKTATGYVGSFFGIVGNADTLLALGLRGVVYRSGNGGASWEGLKMATEATVTAGAVSRAAAGGVVLVNSAGQILLSNAQMRSFSVVHPDKPMRYTGVVLTNQGAAVVTGLDGVRTETLIGKVQ
ncbi:WD40/YVTN/BNR-like repeat-containing protein [Georgfuchsia toluolica]|nr:YCF48-related protein [Georgfuchsia toluolica]